MRCSFPPPLAATRESHHAAIKTQCKQKNKEKLFFKNWFLTVLEAGSLRSGDQHDQTLGRTLFQVAHCQLLVGSSLVRDSKQESSLGLLLFTYFEWRVWRKGLIIPNEFGAGEKCQMGSHRNYSSFIHRLKQNISPCTLLSDATWSTKLSCIPRPVQSLLP